MAFLDVYNAVYDQVSGDSTLTAYVDDSQFIRGFKEPTPQQQYTIIFEPGDETEDHNKQASGLIKEIDYDIDIYARCIFMRGVEYIIIGNSDDGKKGVLEFTEDIKNALRSDLTFDYNRYGSSVSAANGSTSFSLSSIAKYLAVVINGSTPTGYDEINCGSSTLEGEVVAGNIQTSLRALGNHDGDGYNDAICTFNSGTTKFTISSNRYGPTSSVVVTAGASDDCSALLGFDDPTEVVGRNVTKTKIGSVRPENNAYPVRYRIIPITVREEILT